MSRTMLDPEIQTQMASPAALDLVAWGTLREEGQRILDAGVPYLWDGIIPAYGMVGFLVAQAKVGKSSFGTRLMSAISRPSEREFLGRGIQRRRVLYLSLEDPREYLAVMVAQASRGGEDALVYDKPLVLDDATLAVLAETIRSHGIGFVYVATFLNSIRTLIADENDNPGMAVAVNRLKVFARSVGIPILFEAHAGKGEDRSEDADPVRSLRGASAAAAEADYILSLKRAGGGFSTKRTLAGLGRFVSFPPITFDYEGGETRLISAGGAGAVESDWRQILETGAVTAEPRSPGAIALAAGMAEDGAPVPRATRDRVVKALAGRDGVVRHSTGSGRSSRTTFCLSANNLRGGE